MLISYSDFSHIRLEILSPLFSYTVFEFIGSEGAQQVTLSCRVNICHPGDLFYSQCAAGCPYDAYSRKRRNVPEISVEKKITLS